MSGHPLDRAWAPVFKALRATPKPRIHLASGGRSICGRDGVPAERLVERVGDATCIRCWESWACLNGVAPCLCGSGIWTDEEYPGTSPARGSACSACGGSDSLFDVRGIRWVPVCVTVSSAPASLVVEGGRQERCRNAQSVRQPPPFEPEAHPPRRCFWCWRATPTRRPGSAGRSSRPSSTRPSLAGAPSTASIETIPDRTLGHVRRDDLSRRLHRHPGRPRYRVYPESSHSGTRSPGAATERRRSGTT